MSSTVLCRVVNYYLSAPNPPFYILLYSLELCRHFSFRLHQHGLLEGDRLAKEIYVLCLLSKSRHFTMAVGMVLVSSTYPTQLHPPNSLITFQRAIGNWPGPSKTILRDLNPNLQGPSCKLLNSDNPNFFIFPPLPPQGWQLFLQSLSVFPQYSHFVFSILQYTVPTVRPTS